MNNFRINLFKILFLFLILSCGNKFEGKGSIAIYGNKIEVYNENMAELKASNSITEKFYKVRWEVNPSNAADIQYLQNLNNDYGFKSDRRAVIIPSRRGSITIKVFVTDKFTKMEFLIAERNIEVK